MDMLDVVNLVIQEATKGEPWEEGDQMAFVLNDGIVLIALTEERELKVEVIGGKPNFMDLNLFDSVD